MSGSKTASPSPRRTPLSFAKADMQMCFNRIDKKLIMPDREHPLSDR
jgi:hypothetical protein